MLKLELQYSGHLMWRANSLEKSWLVLRKIEDKRRSGRQRIRWLDSITDSMDMSWSKLKEIVKEFMGVLQFMGSQRVGHGLVTEHCQQPPGSSHRIPSLKGSEVCGVLSGSSSNDIQSHLLLWLAWPHSPTEGLTERHKPIPGHKYHVLQSLLSFKTQCPELRKKNLERDFLGGPAVKNPHS